MEIGHLTAFLTLFEERHFGRTGERLFLSGARVSQRIQELEREIGAPLFERTSRKVRPTALGEQMHARLAGPFAQTLAAVDAAKLDARDPRPAITLGFTATTGGTVISSLASRFAAAFPRTTLELTEVDCGETFSAVRDRRVDVTAGWQVHPVPDGLCYGPVLARESRYLVVARDHPLASRDAVTTEDIADHAVFDFAADLDPVLRSAITPERATSGRPIPRHRHRPRTVGEAIAMVASGVVVHPTVASMAYLTGADRIAFVPITDLPPLDLGLITRHEVYPEHLAQFLTVARRYSPALPIEEAS